MSERESPSDRDESLDRPFCRSARFGDEPQARRAYFALQHEIAGAEADISAYRFQVSQVWHVAAVADQPPNAKLRELIEAAIEQGESVQLEPEVLTVFLSRHRQVTGRGLPWVESHYRPGRIVPLED